ncbi:uncharacterized protein LOC133869054 [Alnus glutinosa]|uniref:uncharacterized protein LOC133869054 n=1 Tax=Alnus glutinosa TaxID=3517 RepID=UPI002D7A3711|nr:uncharacterized protein LOC133869054 [Alnus glutinosa]
MERVTIEDLNKHIAEFLDWYRDYVQQMDELRMNELGEKLKWYVVGPPALQRPSFVHLHLTWHQPRQALFIKIKKIKIQNQVKHEIAAIFSQKFFPPNLSLLPPRHRSPPPTTPQAPLPIASISISIHKTSQGNAIVDTHEYLLPPVSNIQHDNVIGTQNSVITQTISNPAESGYDTLCQSSETLLVMEIVLETYIENATVEHALVFWWSI